MMVHQNFDPFTFYCIKKHTMRICFETPHPVSMHKNTKHYRNNLKLQYLKTFINLTLFNIKLIKLSY